MKEQTVALEYLKFEVLPILIRSRVLAFPSWKAHQARKIIKENLKALFSTAKSCVLPVYKRYASISFNLKKSNFSVTTYYSVKNYSNSPYKVGKFNVKY